MAASLRTEAERALTELRRVRDLLADSNPGEAARINARIVALKEALS